MNNSVLLAQSVDNAHMKDSRIPLYDALEEEDWPLVWVDEVNQFGEEVYKCYIDGFIQKIGTLFIL